MGCEYCRGEKPIMANAGSTITIEEDQLWLEYYGHDDGVWEHDTINYCPMCRRKLGDTDD